MKLIFNANEVILSLQPGRADSPPFRAALLGRARIVKDDASTSPNSDMYALPDYVGTKDLEEVSLPASVGFVPPAYFEGKRIYQPDFLDHEDEPPRPSLLCTGAAVAEIYYSEAGSEMSRYHGGDAQVTIALKLETDSTNHSQVLFNALQARCLRPRIDLDYIYFTRHESIRAKFGIQTWDSFLRSECAAFSGEYTLSFSRIVAVGEQGPTKSDHRSS